MSDSNNIISEVAASLQLPKHCEWDERFETALIVLSMDTTDALVTRMKSTFERCWEIGGDEPEGQIKALLESFSGLRAGQKLFTKVVNPELTLFGAYWPWAGNSQVSIRFGVFLPGGGEQEVQDLRNILKQSFVHF